MLLAFPHPPENQRLLLRNINGNLRELRLTLFDYPRRYDIALFNQLKHLSYVQV